MAGGIAAGKRAMNRHSRRSAAAQGRQGAPRADVLRVAMEHLHRADASATGATVLLPGEEPVYVSRATADAMAPQAPAETYASRMKAIHHEAAGLMHVDVVLRDDLPGLIAAAVDGDTQAGELALRINGALFDIGAAAGTAPKLCAVCPRPLAGGNFSLVLATPACDAPSNALALAICHDCASSRQDVQKKATKALRRIWPDLRPIIVTPPDGGRA